MGNRNIQPNLEIIKTALQENKLLSFEYADRYGNRTERTAEPHQLVLKSSHWYWQGYCHTRNDFRFFKLSRTTNLQIQEEVFTPRDYQKPQLDATDIAATMQRKIKIAFIDLSWTGSLIIALMISFHHLTVMSITLLVFRS